MCPSNISKITDLFNSITCLIGKSVIPVIFALAAAVFVFGVVNFFIIGAGDEAKRTQGKQFVVWGIVALAVILSIWGLVRIFGNTFVPNVNTRFLPGVVPSRLPASNNPGSPVCGNGRVEVGEECDPPNLLTCQLDCKKVPNIDPCDTYTGIPYNPQCEH